MRKVVIKGMETGLALPCFNASLVYYDGYRSAKSGANLIPGTTRLFLERIRISVWIKQVIFIRSGD